MTGPVEVVCLGILVADVLARPVDAVPAWGSLELVDEIALRGGGCALNTSSALVRLSVPAAAVGKVGADAFGDFVVGLLDERGVERSGVLRDAATPTSASVALVSSEGERTFLHLPGANARLRRVERSARFGCAAGALATTAVGAFEGVGDLETTLALAEGRAPFVHTGS